MTKILFVCHGNICRSPMAEFYMKDLAGRAGLSETLEIASAAVSAEELGNGVYPRARAAGRAGHRLPREDRASAARGRL